MNTTFYWISVLGKVHDISCIIGIVTMTLGIFWYVLVYDRRSKRDARLLRYVLLALAVLAIAFMLVPSTEELYLIYIQNNLDEVYCDGMLEILEKVIR